MTIGMPKLSSSSNRSGAASANARSRSRRFARRRSVASVASSPASLLTDRLRADRSQPIPWKVVLDVIALLREPGVEAFDEVLGLVAPELGISDEVGLHMLGRGRQFCGDLRRHELAGIRTHRAIRNELAKLRVDLGLRDVGQVLVGEILVLRPLRDRRSAAWRPNSSS